MISSTIVTNALTEGRTDPVFLAVMTGPGMNVSKYLQSLGYGAADQQNSSY